MAGSFKFSDFIDIDDDLTLLRSNTLSLGIPGDGQTTNGRFISIEGNTDSTGEGSSRIFFGEHNSTTTNMDSYGLSIAYRGGADTIPTASGSTWDGLKQLGNGQWGLIGHDANKYGKLFLHGPRSGISIYSDADIFMQRTATATGNEVVYPSRDLYFNFSAWDADNHAVNESMYIRSNGVKLSELPSGITWDAGPAMLEFGRTTNGISTRRPAVMQLVQDYNGAAAIQMNYRTDFHDKLHIHGTDSLWEQTATDSFMLINRDNNVRHMCVEKNGNLHFGTSITNDSGNDATLHINAGQSSTMGSVGINRVPNSDLSLDVQGYTRISSHGGRNFQVIPITGTTSDSVRIDYILLHIANPADNTKTTDNRLQGKISFIRGGTTSWNRKVTHEINTASAYASTRGSIISYNERGQLKLCTYNGVRYLALEINRSSSVYAFQFIGEAYHGTSGTEFLKYVSGTDVSEVDEFWTVAREREGAGTYRPDPVWINGFSAIHYGNHRVVFNGQFSDNTTDLNANLAGGTSQQTIFNTWGRFSHKGDTEAQPASSTEINNWVYDSSQQVIRCTVNSGTYIGFYSFAKTQNYLHQARVTSTAADNDRMALVIAFTVVDGREYTLSAIRNQEQSGYDKWWIAYNYLRSDGWKVADMSSPVDIGNISNWNNYPNGTTIKVRRNGDSVECWTTKPNETTLLDSTRIAINLNDDERLHKFKGAQSYGYACFSQDDTTYRDIVFVDYDVDETESYVFDLTTDRVYTPNSDGSYSLDSNKTLRSEINENQILRDRRTGKMWYFEDSVSSNLFQLKDNGNIFTLSDERQKENLQVIQDPITKINKLTGYTFDFKGSGDSSTGLIAQQVEQVFPQIVHEQDGVKTLNYDLLAGLFVETMKTQQKMIEAQERRIKQLEDKLDI